MAAATIVLCAAIGIVLISRVPAVAPLPRDARVEVGRPPVRPRVTESVVADAVPAHSVLRDRRPGDRAPTRMPLPQSDFSPIDPIRTEPIVLSSIDVPQLYRETTTIDALTVELLTIEPLAMSNE